MPRWFQKARTWAIMGAALAIIATIGLAAQRWLISGSSAWLAAIAFAVAAGAATVIAERAKATLLQPSTMPIKVGHDGRGLDRVRDLHDPLALGVHPAAEVDGSRVPPFVERDVDRELRKAVRAKNFVLLVGESAAGKSRAAYEAIRAALSNYFVVQPAPQESLSGLEAVVGKSLECIIWLDDLERYLGVGGLTRELLFRLTTGGGRVVVVATMRTHERALYDVWSGVGFDDNRREAWRAARAVIELAHEVRLRRQWSEAEKKRAAEQRDQRIVAALEHGGHFGLAENMATGPEIVRSLENAAVAGVRPRGVALVAAAVDCRRAGFHKPVDVSLLKKIHEAYLDALGGAALRPESFEEALSFATTVTYATSPLVPATGGRVLAYDYLIDAMAATPVPEHTWTALVAVVDAADTFDIGMAAYYAYRYPVAEQAFRRALSANVPRAGFMLGATLHMDGQNHRAVRELQSASELENRQENRNWVDVFATRRLLGAALAASGGRVEGLEVVRQTLDDAIRELGPDHISTLLTRRSLAYMTAVMGDVLAAVGQYKEILADFVRLLGLDDPNTVSTRISLAYWVGRSGNVFEAMRQCEIIVPELDKRFGADDRETQHAKHELARWTAEAGRLEEAIGLFRLLLADRIRVLGTDDRDTLTARHNIARYIGESGDSRNAAACYRDVLNDSTRALGPLHRDTLEAKRELARWTAESGDIDAALPMFENLRQVDGAVLGHDDRDVLQTRYQLAFWKARIARSPAALHNFEVVLADQTRILGSDDPDTLYTRQSMATLAAEMGDVRTAAIAFKQLALDRARALGDNHPNTLRTRYALVVLRRRIGDSKSALADLEEIAHAAGHALEASHPLNREIGLVLGQLRAECR